MKNSFQNPHHQQQQQQQRKRTNVSWVKSFYGPKQTRCHLSPGDGNKPPQHTPFSSDPVSKVPSSSSQNRITRGNQQSTKPNREKTNKEPCKQYWQLAATTTITLLTLPPPMTHLLNPQSLWLRAAGCLNLCRMVWRFVWRRVAWWLCQNLVVILFPFFVCQREERKRARDEYTWKVWKLHKTHGVKSMFIMMLMADDHHCYSQSTQFHHQQATKFWCAQGYQVICERDDQVRLVNVLKLKWVYSDLRILKSADTQMREYWEVVISENIFV